ncbi:MAG: hypothetical protein WBQ34_02590 [Candidatus Acidiferrales bacterium]
MKFRGSRVNRRLSLIHLALPLAVAFAVALISAGAENQKHTIKVTFSYDFIQTPACSSKVEKVCVQEFVLYDISAGVSNRTKLMDISVPANHTGLVKSISATTIPLLFEPGKHLLSVVARTPNGVESNAIGCIAWVTVP